MTELHPHDDVLLALALEDITDTERESTLKHLSSCLRCRQEYDGFSATIEQALAAAPSVEPEPGFDSRVLAAMGFEPEPSRAGHPAGRGGGPHHAIRGSKQPWNHRWALVAASIAAGLAVGVGGSYAFTQVTGDSGTVLAENSVFLDTPTGEHVGTVTSSYVDGNPVFVVTVHDGRVGMNYLCVLRLENGEQVPIKRWMLDSDRPTTWIVDAPDRQVTEMVMVANGGAGPVWSTARLS